MRAQRVGRRDGLLVSGAAVYDAGALIAGDRGDRRFWADHRVRLEDGVVAVVPSAVVAQVSRSARQVHLRRLLRGCDVVGLDEQTAHRVGTVLGRAGTADVVDGVVVVVAAARGAAIVTGDHDDIARLLDAAGAELAIVDV